MQKSKTAVSKYEDLPSPILLARKSLRQGRNLQRFMSTTKYDNRNKQKLMLEK